MDRLHVKLGISGTWWREPTKYQILFNDVMVFDGVSGASDVIRYHEFDVDQQGPAVLSVRLVNKTAADTVETADKTGILKDMLLNIHDLEIDGISVTGILHSQSKYQPNEPVLFNGVMTQEISECLNLGWNGTWSLTWTDPFFVWLLDCI